MCAFIFAVLAIAVGARVYFGSTVAFMTAALDGAVVGFQHASYVRRDDIRIFNFAFY